MKIESIERLLNNTYQSIWVCVKWKEPPIEEEYDGCTDFYKTCKAGEEILKFVNENDDDYFYYDGETFIAKKFSHAEYLAECGKFKGQEHWLLDISQDDDSIIIK